MTARAPLQRAIDTALLTVTLGVRILLLVGLLFLMTQDILAYRAVRRGVESGLADDQPPLMTPRQGINVALERYDTNREVLQALASLRDLGYGTLRQRLAWAEIEPSPGEYHWERWDYVLDLVHSAGFSIIVVLDSAPAWARSPHEQANPYAPPQDAASYARFAAALAERYGNWILAYQIWDQPNIYPHWGQGEIDPAGYVALLAAAAPAIRQADPDAVIIAGGLAPNLESGGRNMSDVQYLREIYRRGAGQWFDVLGVKAYGFWSGPYDRRTSPEVLNLSRVILLREEMVRRGEAHKPIWALDGGWVALPAGWEGAASPLGNDAADLQAARLWAATQRVQREWPWMPLFTALHLQPNAPEDDPIWGLSLLDPYGRATPLLTSLQSLGPPDEALHPGLHLLGAAPDTAETADEQDLDLTFWGSDLRLWVDRGAAEGEIELLGAQQESLSLGGASRGVEPVWLARFLPLATYPVVAVGTPEELGAIAAVQVGNRTLPLWLWSQTALGLVAAIWLVVSCVQDVRTLPWRRVWRAVCHAWGRLPEPMQMGALALLLLAALTCPHGGLRLALLACYGLGTLLRPDVALLLALAAVPLAPLSVAIGPGRFAPSEIALLIAAAARLGNALLTGRAQGGRPSAAPRITWLDALALLYVLWGAVSAGLAEYQRVAWREFRVVIAEPALLYALLRLGPQDGEGRARQVRVFFASAVAVALYALARYPSAAGVIQAEGVRRARAFFGSPNNLALYLERFLPLGIAMALWGAGRWRRRLYAVGAAALAIVIVLTFSRGAWLLGVPAGLLALFWLRGGRARRLAWIGAAAALVALVVVLRMPRFASLVDLSQGTGFLRIQLWRSAWEMVQDHLWLGIGPDNFLYYYGDYILPGAEVDRWLSHPHNLVLDPWLRLGLPGLALTVAMFGAALTRALRLLRGRCRGVDRAVLIGLLGGLAAAGAHGLIDSAWFVVELAYWGMFTLAWLASGPGRHEAFDTDPSLR